MDTYLNSGSRRSWADLPLEILSFIAIRLPILELLRFRVTCKGFQSASSSAIAIIQSSKDPWLLLSKTSDTIKCILRYNKGVSKTFNLKIPDLNGAICLASYQGWLLLFKNKSMYFLSPFSGSKITLPEFPHEQIDGHVGMFSHVPTSPECIISIINPIERAFEINLLSKGQNAWTQHTRSEYFDVKPTISAATFDHETQTFYYMHGTKSVLTFSVKDKIWKTCHIVSVEEITKDTEQLPFYCEKKLPDTINDQKVLQLLDLQEDEYVNASGLTYKPENYKHPVVYKNETANVSPTKTRACKAVWIEPRLFEVHQDKDLHW